MTSALIAAGMALATVGAVAYFAWQAVVASLVQGGADAALAERARADLAVAKRQAEIMAQDVTPEQTVNRLEDHTF